MNDNVKKCPKCGHENASSSEECIKCGVIFSKYFEVKERKLRETLSDLDRSVLEDIADGEDSPEVASEKKKVLVELAKAEAERRKIEEQEKAAARRKAATAEPLKKQRKGATKAEARVKGNAEKAIKAPLPKKPVVEAPPGALDKSGLQRIARLEKEAETLRLQTAALQKEKQAYEKAETAKKEQLEQARLEALQKIEAAREKMIALEEEALALRKEAETLKKEKADLAAEAARRKARDEKEAEQRRQVEKEARERAAALEQERRDAEKRMAAILKTVVPKPTMKELLKKYEGEPVGINFDDPAEIKGARLAKVNEDHFSIIVPENELVHSYPYSDILSIVEGADGVPIDTSDETPTYPVVIRVMHLMVKKKWGFI